MATRTKRTGKRTGKRKMARKTGRGSTKRKAASKRGKVAAGARKRGGTRTATKRRAPAARVKRVAREVVQQATGAVNAGVETLRDIGENIMERVRA